ncbi:MAG: hypothetical protein ABI830_08500 [Pseudolabrys sp.]
MLRAPLLLALAGLSLGVTLSGCSGAMMSDQLPQSMGGSPQGAPARPAVAYQYPAVHDMPPDRPTTPMSEEDQVKMENDLKNVRDRQEAQEGQKPKNPKSSAAVTNKKPVSAKQKPAGGVIVVPPAGAADKP